MDWHGVSTQTWAKSPRAGGAVLDAQAVAPTAGEGGAMDDGVGGTEEAEQELFAALTPVEENKATDAENPPT